MSPTPIPSGLAGGRKGKGGENACRGFLVCVSLPCVFPPERLGVHSPLSFVMDHSSVTVCVFLWGSNLIQRTGLPSCSLALTPAPPQKERKLHSGGGGGE